jgi:hypothetical protein
MLIMEKMRKEAQEEKDRQQIAHELKKFKER